MQGATAGLFLFAVLVVFAIIVVAKSVTLIPQAEAAVIERLGRYSRTISGQLTLLIPFIDRVRARAAGAPPPHDQGAAAPADPFHRPGPPPGGPARTGGVVPAATGDHRGQP